MFYIIGDRNPLTFWFRSSCQVSVPFPMHAKPIAIPLDKKGPAIDPYGQRSSHPCFLGQIPSVRNNLGAE